MSALGSVERVLVLGIVVVIVAILGIAVWGATGDDPGAPVASASGGGADTGVPAVASPGTGAPPTAAITPIEQIERWRKLREEARAKQTEGEQVVPPAVTKPLAGGPRVEPVPTGTTTDASTVPLKTESLPFQNSAMPEPAQVNPLRPTPEPPVARAEPVAPAPPVTLRKAEPVAPPKPEPKTVVVAEGDTLWAIAVRQYGNSDIQEHVDAILAANPSVDASRIKAGQRLVMPEAGRVAIDRLPAEKQVQLESGELYKVQSGDTLTGIAQKKLGSAQRWQEIYDLNRERIVDPSMLFVGTTLRLPQG